MCTASAYSHFISQGHEFSHACEFLVYKLINSNACDIPIELIPETAESISMKKIPLQYMLKILKAEGKRIQDQLKMCVT